MTGKPLLAAALLLFSALPLAAEQPLIDGGGSAFVIVHAGARSRHGAALLREMLKSASGAELKVLAEKEYTPGTPAIFIGPTAQARSRKLIPAQYAPWEYRIDIGKGCVFLTGSDSPGDSVKRAEFESGTLKAVIEFLERFCGGCFYAPVPLKQCISPQKRILLPDSFSLHVRPHIIYCSSRSKRVEYDLATNAFYAHDLYKSLGGHSHPAAVPAAKLFKSHPEYFALINGKRLPGRFNQLCISDPQVRELIYKNLLEQADRGTQMVQLGQSDSWTPCQCVKCAGLYGLKPAGKPGSSAYDKDPVWGEKLWIMHRDMALRFLKDRPGKKAAVMAYGPTRVPPKSFREFPPNVWIELAPFNDSTIASWQGYKVGTFSAYLYIWGVYNPEGYTPRCSFAFLRREAAGYRKHSIRGLYRCGFGELQGLCGPAYYIWGKMLQDPAVDAQALLSRYCRFAFPGAADGMTAFYQLLDSRLELELQNSPGIDWNDPALLKGRSRHRKNIALFELRYPEEVLQKLESLLAQAEKKCRRPLLAQARAEFDYLKLTARGAQAFARWQKEQNAENWEKLLSAVEKRERFLKSLPRNKKGCLTAGGNVLFGGAALEQLMGGGRLSATLYAPFNWGAVKLRKYDIRMTGRTMKAGAPEWQYLMPRHRQLEIPADFRPVTIKFRAARNAEAVKFTFVLSHARKELMKDCYIHIYLGPDRKNMFFFPARFTAPRPAWYKLEKSTAENGGMGEKYRIRPGRMGTVAFPAPGVSLEPGEISAEVTLPFSVFGKRPAPGEAWPFNAGAGIRNADYIWEYNPDQISYSSASDAKGKLLF